MKRRIIINIETDITDERALALVAQVVDMGRVSRTKNFSQYCFATVTQKEAIYATKRSLLTDTFTIASK